jgi:hypothetical protein
MPRKTNQPVRRKASATKKALAHSPAEEMDAELDAGLAGSGFYRAIRNRPRPYHPATVKALLKKADEPRVKALAQSVATYILANLPKAISRRKGLAGYRTSPYVLLTSANVMRLTDPRAFAKFLFDSKLYAGLETSFGKSIEAAFVGHYPIGGSEAERWGDPAEKLAEFAALKAAKLTREEKARRRTSSAWREIDKSVVVGRRRYLITIKSGPNCINDTQVTGMVAAIREHSATWLNETKKTYPGVTGLDVVIGLTYGTDLTTNNKENQILAKLQDFGFREEGRTHRPGVLVNASGDLRVYRCIGQDFWSFIGSPQQPSTASFVFMEVLLALAKALTTAMTKSKAKGGDVSLEDRVNEKLDELIEGLRELKFPRDSLPEWVRTDFVDHELFWLATAIAAFFDNGV